MNIFWLLASLLFISCASKSRVQTYFEEGGKKQALPDSAKVKAVLSVSQGGVKENLSAVLFVVPNEKYRLELSGTFGLSAASILWKNDGWKIVFTQDERYMEGTGDCVFVPMHGGVDIHKFAILFLGQRVNTIGCNDSDSQNISLDYRENHALAFFGNDSLKLEIKAIDPKADWKDGVWNLNVPEKYVKIHFPFN
jgi:hypothetical protein